MLILLGACTTRFNTVDSATDTALDPAGDVEDGTDGTPGQTVVCYSTNTVYVSFEPGTLLEWGCDTTGSNCSSTGLWMDILGENLVIAAGADRSSGAWGGHVFGTCVSTADGTLTPGSAIRITPSASEEWDIKPRSMSMVQRTPDAPILLFSRQHWDETLDRVTDQSLEALRLTCDTSGMIESEPHVIIQSVGSDAPAETRTMSLTRGIRVLNDLYLFFMMEEETMTLPRNELFGGTIGMAQFNSGTMYTFGYHFVPMGTIGPDLAHYPAQPEYTDNVVALPWMRMRISGDIGEFASGLWLFNEPIYPGTTFTPGMVTLDSPDNFEACLSGTRLGAFDSYAMAAISTNVTFTETGLEPPYNLNVGAANGLSGTTIDRVVPDQVWAINETLFRTMDVFDATNYSLLFDESRRIFHYVMPLYVVGGTAQIAVFSFFEDGMPAWGPEGPFYLDTGAWELPAFDAVIDPATGRIFISKFMGEDASPPNALDGFYVDEIDCEVVWAGP